MSEQELRGNDWIQVYSGKPFWPLDPREEEIDINDIAHALSLQCRYSGHVERFYSVAEHSYWVSYAVPQEFALWGLLHDASEAYLVDLPKPLKPLLPQYKAAEEKLMRLIADKYGLLWPEPLAVKGADYRILFNEKAALLKPSTREWGLTGEPLPGIRIDGWVPFKAKIRFLNRFHELTNGQWDF